MFGSDRAADAAVREAGRRDALGVKRVAAVDHDAPAHARGVHSGRDALEFGPVGQHEQHVGIARFERGLHETAAVGEVGDVNGRVVGNYVRATFGEALDNAIARELRTSSVPARETSPHTPIVSPGSPSTTLSTNSTMRRACSAPTRSVAETISRPILCAAAACSMRLTSCSKRGSAKPGLRNWEPMRRS